MPWTWWRWILYCSGSWHENEMFSLLPLVYLLLWFWLLFLLLYVPIRGRAWYRLALVRKGKAPRVPGMFTVFWGKCFSLCESSGAVFRSNVVNHSIRTLERVLYFEIMLIICIEKGVATSTYWVVMYLS